MGQISTRIFDTDRNTPAEGIPVRLERPVAGYEWEMIAGGITDADGRVPHLLADHKRLPKGAYRFVFEIEDYFRESGRTCFYPFIPVVFEIQDGIDYHVPLSVGSDSYSTSKA